MNCPSGKVVHTLATAKAASKRARRRTETPLVPYRCAICGQWHVGQRTEAKRPTEDEYQACMAAAAAAIAKATARQGGAA